jgi:hypothetical protein
LPVIEEDGRLVAIVDVLKLTYATLEQVCLPCAENFSELKFTFQMNAMAGGDTTSTEAEGGPMWGRFFDSIGHEDTESLLSGSHAPRDHRSFSSINDLHLQQSPHSEVHPNDSASVVDDEPGSVLDGYPRHKGLNIPSGAAPIPVDDGTYVFKFRTPSGRTHRFQARHDDVEHLREIVSGKLATDPFFTEFQPKNEDSPKPDPIDFHLSYTDADGDTVLITSDDDITDAVKIARTAGTDRVVLFVQGGKGWAEAGADKSEAKAAAATAAAQKDVKEVEKAEEIIVVTPPPVEAPIAPKVQTPPVQTHRAHAPPAAEQVFGIPKDLLLPASIGALAVVIIGVFTISRLGSSSRY